MKFIIHGEWPDGTEDSFEVEGDSIGEITVNVHEETDKRNWKNCWSEEVK